MATATDTRLEDCIERCLDCYQICFSTAMQRCLPGSGAPAAGRSLALVLNCAEICRTAAEFMMSRSPLHGDVCAACAAVCEACAASSEQAGGMEACVQACRRCAESCRAMSSTGTATTGLAGSVRQETDAPVKAPM